ncbi:hypothetical protein KCP77_06795 [Salmonella enterica subsp. enterica]|nr:hypothetical protein KCP77_06795 [Salmonella enterica subsp. enterica]
MKQAILSSSTGVVQRNERRDDDASTGHLRWCYTRKTQDEAKLSTGCVKDTSGRTSRSGMFGGSGRRGPSG